MSVLKIVEGAKSVADAPQDKDKNNCELNIEVVGIHKIEGSKLQEKANSEQQNENQGQTKRSGQREKKQPKTGIVGAAANHFSPQAARVRQAGNVLRNGQKDIEKVITQYSNCDINQTAGRVAEEWHKTTFKVDAALKNRPDLDVTVGPKGGIGSRGSADLTVTQNGNKVAEAGLKYRNKPTNTAFDQSNTFDAGRQKVCPSDQLDKVRELANKRAETGTLKASEYADTAKNATDKLTHENVQSKPLSKAEANDLVKNPGRLGQDAFLLEMGQAAKGGAIFGAAAGAVASSFKNISACMDGEKEVEEALVDIAGDTVKSGAQGALLGVGGVVVKQGLTKAGLNGLAKGALPVAIASSAFEAGCHIVSDLDEFIDGGIDGVELTERAVVHTAKAATKGAAAWGGAEAGAAIGSLLGPLGTLAGGVIGGMAGYMFGSAIVG